jgi:hypothetical protein
MLVAVFFRTFSKNEFFCLDFDMFGVDCNWFVRLMVMCWDVLGASACCELAISKSKNNPQLHTVRYRLHNSWCASVFSTTLSVVSQTPVSGNTNAPPGYIVSRFACRTARRTEKRGKRQVLLRPSSKVIIKFLQLMMKKGLLSSWFDG